jgi:hypothetical protein
MDGKITVSSNYTGGIASMVDLRHIKLSASNLLPYTPSNVNARK